MDLVPALLCDEKGLKEDPSVLRRPSFTRGRGDMITQPGTTPHVRISEDP